MSGEVTIKMRPQGKVLGQYMRSRGRVTFIMGPLGCTDADTEYLSRDGWRRIADWSGDDVAQWADGRLEFVSPTRYVKEPCDEMWLFENEHSVSMMLSDEHRMPLYDWSGRFVVKTAAQVAERPSKHTVPVHFSCIGPGIGLSDAQIRLRVMIAADGTYPKAGHQCIITVRKDRKKTRIREILNACGIQWKEVIHGSRPDELIVTFQRPGFSKPLHESANWYEASTSELEVMLEELTQWDGLADHFEYRFFTAKKEEADVVQFAAHACCRTARIHLIRYGKENWRDGYTVQWTAPNSRKAVVAIRCDGAGISRQATADGLKYCFSVPSSFWVARRKGRVFVTGNSGKTYQSAQKVLTLMTEQAPNAQGVRKSRWYAVRNTYPDLLSTTVKDWVELFGQLGRFKGGGAEPPSHTLDFDLPDGSRVQSEIVFQAMDRDDSIKKLRGAQVTGFWLNEVKELRKSVIDMADLRHGRYPSATDGGPTWHGMIGDTNAPEHGHWYQLLANDPPDGWEFYTQPGGVIRSGKMPDGRARWVSNDRAENLNNLPDGYYSRGMAGKSDEWIATNLANEYGNFIEGAYYATQMSALREKGRITEVPYDPGVPVNTFWDLGRSDAMAIWFHQRVGQTNRLIDYFQGTNAGFDVYAKMLRDRGYNYGQHYMPHDTAVRDLGPGSFSRKEHAENLGIRPIQIVRRPRNIEEVLDGIETTRRFLAACWIDSTTCALGIRCLEGYHREFDEVTGKFKANPCHDWASDGADSLRTGATGFVEAMQVQESMLYPEAF